MSKLTEIPKAVWDALFRGPQGFTGEAGWPGQDGRDCPHWRDEEPEEEELPDLPEGPWRTPWGLEDDDYVPSNQGDPGPYHVPEYLGSLQGAPWLPFPGVDHEYYRDNPWLAVVDFYSWSGSLGHQWTITALAGAEHEEEFYTDEPVVDFDYLMQMIDELGTLCREMAAETKVPVSFIGDKYPYSIVIREEDIYGPTYTLDTLVSERNRRWFDRADREFWNAVYFGVSE